MITFTRRNMLSTLGGVIAGSAATAAFPASAAEPLSSETIWEARIVDPGNCAALAYEGYWQKGCCYGAFHGIIGEMGRKYGTPYTAFPCQMMEVGKGGICGWGAFCGALLGAVNAFGLFWSGKELGEMVDELLRWYEVTAFPIYEPGQRSRFAGSVPTTVSDSVLCHISVSRWCYETGHSVGDNERFERCSRLTADVTKKAVEIMNARIQGTFVPVYGTQESVEFCSQCHGKGGESDISLGKQNCAPCHGGGEAVSDKFTDHP